MALILKTAGTCLWATIYDPQPKKKKGNKKKDPDSDDDEDQNAAKRVSSPEIVDMHLVWEDDLIMMLCCNAKEYIVYDESDVDKS